jgi:hypothetical protein
MTAHDRGQGAVDLVARLDEALARLSRLEDAEAARNLLHAYASVLDDPTPEAVAALFSENGVLEVPMGRFEGRAAVAAFYRSRLGPKDGDKRHFLCNLRIRHPAPGTVEIASYFLFTGRNPGTSALGWGTYLDRIQVHDGVAAFAHKAIVPHVNTDLSRGWPSDLGA